MNVRALSLSKRETDQIEEERPYALAQAHLHRTSAGFRGDHVRGRPLTQYDPSVAAGPPIEAPHYSGPPSS